MCAKVIPLQCGPSSQPSVQSGAPLHSLLMWMQSSVPPHWYSLGGHRDMVLCGPEEDKHKQGRLKGQDKARREAAFINANQISETLQQQCGLDKYFIFWINVVTFQDSALIQVLLLFPINWSFQNLFILHTLFDLGMNACSESVKLGTTHNPAYCAYQIATYIQSSETERH